MLSQLPTLEEIEVQLLFDGIYRYYGYDFRNYAPSSRRRRVQNFMQSEGIETVSALQGKVLHDRAMLDRLLLSLTVNVTSMFRDPSFFLTFRNLVLPILRTYPFIRIWHAGCSTGEEVYSMAILLQEEGLYPRCRIYATDTNEQALQAAKNGIFPLSAMQDYTQQYLKAGGKKSFSEYYVAAYENAMFKSSLRDNIVFSQHNLVTDGSFNEFNVILCRNVLIYFDRALQNHVHELFYQSLCSFGVLALGRQESLRFMNCSDRYEILSSSEKLYRRVS